VPESATGPLSVKKSLVSLLFAPVPGTMIYHIHLLVLCSDVYIALSYKSYDISANGSAQGNVRELSLKGVFADAAASWRTSKSVHRSWLSLHVASGGILLGYK
jgi:hypothetical protein